MKNRIRLLDVITILFKYTDPQHHLSLAKIVEKLGEKATQSRKRTVEEDIDAIRESGIDVRRSEDRGDYYINSRTPDKVEISILVECVLNSKLFSEKTTQQMIDRLTAHLSKYQKENITLHKEISGRVKSHNENIYFVVEQIQDAIVKKRCIEFKYYSWGEGAEQIYHNHGLPLCVSPYFTVFDDENYYLIGYAHYASEKRHYRIDKMEEVKILPGDRVGENLFKNVKVTDYTTRHFGMFDGDQALVTLICQCTAYNIIYDRFGTATRCVRIDEDHFRTNVTVTLSNLFYGWLFSMGQLIRLEGPDEIVDDYMDYIRMQLFLYKNRISEGTMLPSSIESEVNTAYE